MYEVRMTIVRAFALVTVAVLCAAGCKSEDKKKTADPAKADPAKADPASADPPPAAGDWKKVDLFAEGHKSGETSLSGTIEVPPDAKLEFGTSKGIDDLPVDSVFVKANGFDVTLDQGPGSADMPTTLANYIKKVQIADTDVLEKSENPRGGYAISYRVEGNVAVQAVYPNLSCAVTLEAKDADKIQTAFRICSSYDAPAE
jgi:hypothetical protein